MGQIFIAALKEETPNLKDFHYSGVGKINATIKIMELISKFQPNEIINYGTAGSTNQNLSGLVECTKFVQRDMDARGLMNFKLGETPFDPISKITYSNEGYICASLMHMDKVKLVDIAGNPVSGANHLDWHCANTPAIIKFSRMSPERMRHDLMAEANSDKRFASGENFSDKCHQSVDKVGIIIDPIG